jgi:uncharacterized RDD family membrane protein YckC
MSGPEDHPPGAAPRETDFAAAWSPDTVTRTFSPGPGGHGVDLPFLFATGQRFGAYLIVRPIGKGGMGQVYEAEEIDSGRRVAIKILSRGIGDEEERERFLIEGRIAASLSHPNLVYVFGTSEVQGLPVIAMELAPAGTLKDLVVNGGPLPAAKAVDAILHVIAGLETAAAAGILHRDIKPSNCFVGVDGRVLVGDFGLSVATLGRVAEHPGADGMIAGTPGFASPEQLRGDRLDVRSDIYSVGATLYYLLTGRAPVEHDSIRTFITRTALDVPISPAVLRRDVPKKLAAIVTQCLAATPEKRFASYAALAAALEPHRSVTRTAAGLGRRFLAGAIDTYVSDLPIAPISIKVGGLAIASNQQSLLLMALPTLALIVGYYGLLEGFFGAAAGKGLLGLRVVQRDGSRPGFLRAVSRAAIFVLPGHVLKQALYYWLLNAGRAAQEDAAGAMASLAVLLISCGTLAALFSTARQRNGYAGLHDIGSSTRVVMHRRRVEARAENEASRRDRTYAAGPSRIGPYLVSEPGDASPPNPVSTPTLVDGYDDRLRRPVWILRLPCGSPPLPPLRRDLARPARPRWLAGRRTDAECWDAFEATDGGPLGITPQPWSRVRHWLADLTHEAAAGLVDGSLPPLDVDRVWIGADDHARLLDWPAGKAIAATHCEVSPPPNLTECCRFLYRVVLRALRGSASAPDAPGGIGLPLPLPGRNLLLALRDGRYNSADELTAGVDAALRTPATVSHTTRALQFAVSMALPLIVPAIALYALATIARVTNIDPQVMDLQFALGRIAEAKTPPEERAALETYVATHLRATVDDPSTWARPLPFGNTTELQARARRIVDAHPNVSPRASAEAEAVAQAYLVRERKQLADMRAPDGRAKVVAISASYTLCLVAILALVAALVLRGGLIFRAFGTALVRSNGGDVSRIRAFARALIAWSPAILVVVLPRVSPVFAFSAVPGVVLAAGAAVVMLAGGAWAIIRPSRGIPDRLVGTWLVPR